MNEAMETNRGTFRPPLEEQYKIWLENQPDKGKDLSKMSRKHKLRMMKKGALKHIK